MNNHADGEPVRYILDGAWEGHHRYFLVMYIADDGYIYCNESIRIFYHDDFWKR